MAELKLKSVLKKTKGKREFVFSLHEKQLLKNLGLKIHGELYKQNKPVEAFASELGIARSTLREIIAGRSNLRLLTLVSLVRGLGYKNLAEFFRSFPNGK